MASRVFISYASADRRVAEQVCSAFESGGTTCWIAPRDIGPAREIAGIQEKTGELSRSLEGSLQKVREADEKLVRLDDAAKIAGIKLQSIEKELKTAHYVFTAHSEFPVWGMDIFIRFGKWKKTESELEGFCVSAVSKGPCLNGKPERLRLGSTLVVDSAPYRYSITARYGIGILLAHDQVGFDVNREFIK